MEPSDSAFSDANGAALTPRGGRLADIRPNPPCPTASGSGHTWRPWTRPAQDSIRETPAFTTSVAYADDALPACTGAMKYLSLKRATEAASDTVATEKNVVQNARTLVINRNLGFRYARRVGEAARLDAGLGGSGKALLASLLAARTERLSEGRHAELRLAERQRFAALRAHAGRLRDLRRRFRRTR